MTPAETDMANRGPAAPRSDDPLGDVPFREPRV